MGGVVKKVGNALGFGDAGNLANQSGIGNLNFGQMFAGGQRGFAHMQDILSKELLARSQGKGPSVADAQLQQATDQNIAQQQALAASARGGNVGMAQRNAAMNAANIQQQAAGQSGLLRLQEQQQAQQQLGQTLAQGQQYNLGLIQAGNQRDLWQSEAASRGGQSMGGLLGGVGAAIALSDEDMKKEVKDASGKIESFLDALGAHEYEYKGKAKSDPKGGKGKHVSPMAQEIEQTSAGKGMVKNTSQGKVVDYGKGFGVMMASLANLHDRLKKMEGKS